MVTGVWMVFLLMAEAVSSEIITVSASGGGDALLKSGLLMHGQEDIRWTHRHLLLTKNRTSPCLQGRCELCSDGSLKFSRVQTGDAGNYTLEVFDEGGKLKHRKDFLLQVEDVSSSSVGSLTFIFCLLPSFLLLLLIAIFILRRRSSQRITITGPKEENIYEDMHGRRGNKEENVYAMMHGRCGNKEENVYAMMHGRCGKRRRRSRRRQSRRKRRSPSMFPVVLLDAWKHQSQWRTRTSMCDDQLELMSSSTWIN
ncbi:uncharacterized protein LOC110971706 [Acanthochromis polyacanthus]|uniref:uncharacterized protein LOC110971706 n=1 Tax=Acanthochromis polyacanthus TaxID=80966 RepID=UPI002233E9E4|nr:uncharacterized protein LOC110971706 [Acanthochromis polyacanthus]